MCAKRSSSDVLDDPTAPAAKQMSGWKRGLLSSMQSIDLFVREDKRIVVIKDKYPKAEYHFLILPKEDILNMSKVTNSHISLLKHMHSVGKDLENKYHRKFLLGYHAVPSMTRLHLHVISTDFNSPCLKTKKHWNSFTTKFFVMSESVIRELENTGRVAQLPATEAKTLMNTPLKCHRCEVTPKNMPELKKHLLIHLK